MCKKITGDPAGNLVPDIRLPGVVLFAAVFTSTFANGLWAQSLSESQSITVPQSAILAEALPMPSASIAVAANTTPTLQQVFQQLSESKQGTAAGAGTTASEDAKTDHPLEILAEQADEFARAEHVDAERVEVSVIPIDRRLRLKRCDTPISYSWTSATKTMGNTTVTAQCDGSAPWKVLIRAQVRVFHTIPILAVPANKGDELSSDMVTTRLFDVSSLRRETLRSVDKVIGYRFKRRLAAGREISSAILAAPLVVSKGDQVLISDSNAVIDVQLKGTAMSGGEVGRKISVRSNSSGRVIQTWIRGPGLVVVSP